MDDNQVIIHCMLSQSYGQYTTYQTREEGRQEKGGQICLFGETCAPDGSVGRKARSRIIYFENSAKEIKPIVLNDITTTKQLEEEIVKHVPINTYVIGLRMSPTRMGSVGRMYLDGAIPDDVENIYINMYLKKHPRI